VSVRILVGDARAGLAALPAESVHCVVTSPPYWGLRDYGLPPTVWGGEDPGCAHAWATAIHPGMSGGMASPMQAHKGLQNFQAFGPTEHATCARCGAWRGALGLEPTPAAYVAHLVEVFRAVRRVLREDATCWVNLGDSYATRWGSQRAEGRRGMEDNERSRGGPVVAGLKEKDLVGIPWRVAFALQADGWWLRSEIIWHKPSPMPESVTDRPTKAHEQLFLLAKAERYFYDADAIREDNSDAENNLARAGLIKRASPKDLAIRAADGNGLNPASETAYGQGGRNKRSVWTIPSAPFSEAHFATFPPALVEPCLKAGTSERGACPACGAPWRRAVAETFVASSGHLKGGQKGLYEHFASGWAQCRPGRIESETLGWAPTCACAAGEPRPCVALDPFAGAGTVGLVADRLGRDAILVDLKPEYAAMAERRIREEAPLLTAVAVEAAAPSASGNGHGRAAPEQLALDWAEIACVDV
jgi:DNA modification methylase